MLTNVYFLGAKIKIHQPYWIYVHNMFIFRYLWIFGAGCRQPVDKWQFDGGVWNHFQTFQNQSDVALGVLAGFAGRTDGSPGVCRAPRHETEARRYNCTATVFAHRQAGLLAYEQKPQVAAVPHGRRVPRGGGMEPFQNISKRFILSKAEEVHDNADKDDDGDG